MKENRAPEYPFVQLWQLYSMEQQVARNLPMLSGSAVNVQLRKLLKERCMRSRERRIQLALLMHRCQEAPAEVVCVVTRGILSGGNKILARIGDPQMRDVMMAGHCLRVENHQLGAYCTAVRLAERGGYAAEASLLASLKSDLKTARPRLRSFETSLSTTVAKDSSGDDFEGIPWDIQTAAHP